MRARRLLLLGALLALPATAQAMSANDWIRRFEALQGPGKAQQRPAELAAVLQEVGLAIKRYDAAVKSASAAGRPPRACLPPQVSLKSSELLVELKKLPPAVRAGDFGTAFDVVMDRRYPCPKAAASRPT